MDYVKLLTLAKVPSDLHQSAIASLTKAESRAKGLTVAKWKIRLFKAKRISKLLDWKDERLVDQFPELAEWDIAPMVNITAHGDNVPWVNTPEGGRPAPGQWLNPDPTSAEYQDAVKANYWKEGTHPRSKESRFAWYRRNAGEYAAWKRGEPVSLNMEQNLWTGEADGTYVKVQRCGDVWFLLTEYKKFKFIPFTTRIGFEIDNVISIEKDPITGEEVKVQSWYPIRGHDLKAPVTWSTLPGKR